MAYKVRGGNSGGSGGAAFTDEFSLKMIFAENNALPTDDATFAMELAQSDSNAEQSEAVTLGFSGTDFQDSSDIPTDAQSFTVRCWLSGSAGTGVTNPANANGQNDAVRAVVSTAVASPATETLTSALGTNIPSATVSSAIYRGWFNCTRPLGTSTVVIIAHSTSALFGDITMFSGTGTVNHDSGDFTFDLIAAGVNTLAKLQSLEILHRTTDVAAGVTPAVLNVDAGCCEIAGAF